MKIIDDFLNNITMYRLVLYYLIVLLIYAGILSFLGFLSFGIISLIYSTAFILLVCWVTNKIFGAIFEVPTNPESIYISALILTLVITPPSSFFNIGFLFWTAVWVAASKYILAINKKHIFNPVAIALVIVTFVGIGSASWWVGTSVMLPVVVIGGLLITRKIRRFDMVFIFLLVGLFTIITLSFFKGSDPWIVLNKALLDSPILFFSFVMLTEPMTTPPTKKLQVIYAAIVGILFAPQINFLGFFTTPEIALCFGNIFSYVVSPKERLMLTLKEKVKLAPGIYDFVFNIGQKFTFIPGQYLEFTLGIDNPDTRGIRRYFTIASAPEENNIRIGVRFYPNASSFKKVLAIMNPGDKIFASQLSGEFNLPKDKSKKLCYIAGGIGITPFRSMIKYLTDENEKRDIVLLYSNKTNEEAVYKDVFESAKNIGLKTFYIETDKTGFLNAEMIKQEIPDFLDRMFYISGSHSMVDSFEKTLKQMGIKDKNIKIDFFPGYA